ncbi:MAG: hypothetical protein JRF33_16755, partial [Deltaproteobacteria bacterium]|nr:hypothetical protein [Deltaproteobacteria bacterium]
TCQGAAGWSVCDYGSEYEAEETLCDGKDNDCDGDTDEDGVCWECGNGIVEDNEDCDDFNSLSCGTCNASCDGAGDGPTCPNGEGCAFDGDCASGVCTANVCE